MENIKYILYKLTGSVYVPPQLKGADSDLVLHISDTPICFFSPLKKLITKIKPRYIIHTGDLVDNLKLGLSDCYLPRYEKDVKLLLDIMEGSSAEAIYICCGNHDNKEILTTYTKRSHVFDKAANLQLQGISFRISHFPGEILQDPREFNLYGHDLTLRSGTSNGINYLNGITSINVISLQERTYYELPYPFGTDDMRLRRGKLGL